MVPGRLTLQGGRFEALAHRLGAIGDPAPAAKAVLDAYATPERRYHGLAHLADCLARLDETSTGEAVDRDRVEAALWFHDVVYDAHSTDNEERSARWAQASLEALGITSPFADEVARLVRLTDHRVAPTDVAGQVVCDIDLSILGRPPEEFDAYDRAIRAEYSWVPDDAYRIGRRQVLTRLLARQPLFTTQAFRERYETAARANLSRALARLAGE